MWLAPERAGKLTAPVAALPAAEQERSLARLTQLPAYVVVDLRDLAGPMARLQQRHRAEGRRLSAAMTEALAAAHSLGAAICVSRHDVGAHLAAAAEHDGIAFHAL